jgi:flavin-dependent dehydrogenase
MTDGTDCDVLVIGGGPGGATAALQLARAGIKVILLEKGSHPRFHIGESFLPRNMPLLRELGLEASLRKLPHMPKFGAEFGLGNDPNTTRFTFDMGLVPGSETFNIARAHFDGMLFAQAAAAGADCRQNVAVREILELTDGRVRIATDQGELTARYLIDASGHGTVVGRKLGTRRPHSDQELHKVAYFSHFTNVKRLEGKAAGHPGIIMCQEGWFWLIALDEMTTSVGFVTRAEVCRSAGVSASRMLAWAISRCPVVRDRMAQAAGPVENQVLADFSYTCWPFSGPGYFLVGDAAAFLDPIFSTGATMAMMSACEAARCLAAVLKNGAAPAAAQRRYRKYVRGSTKTYFRLIRTYYQHSFRELFMNGTGPMKVHNAVISVLAGEVFPRPPWKLRWRLWLFYFFVWLNKRVATVPRRAAHSLLEAEPIDWSPAAQPSTAAPAVTA